VGELQALLLGLVQGLTEFLPVSSSGHLVIGQALLGVEREGLLFEVVLHVATLGSVLLFYRRRVAGLVSGALRGDATALRYLAKLALATLPAVGAVLGAGEALEARFESARLAASCLLATGALLWTTRYTAPAARVPEPGWGAALLIGCAQALALLPGISRSGATVAAALALGVAPAAAAEFSFLMSVVAVAGAALYELPALQGAAGADLGPLGVGFAAALISGVAAIWLFVRLLRGGGFHRFAWYTWSVGLGVLLWLGWA
jgi:undecaprenyl-diphosphatase